MVNNIIERSESGQPVLVGTTSVETSEFLSDRLRKRSVPHQVLNARNHEHEASIIAQAGRAGAVTVSTNMAGRGTDIVLGGADTDRDDWQEEHNRVIALGGLHVIGTEHHEARRVDNQLRGRAGRQGDPGSSQFFVALEDELMQRFGGDRIKNVMSWTGLNDDEPLENRLITKSINSAQVKVEGHHFDIRKHLLNFDDVLQQQRSVIYEQRSRILAGEGLQERLIEMLLAEFDGLIATHLQARHADDWNVDGFLTGLRQICPPPPEMNSAESVLSLRKEQIADILEQHAETLYRAKERELGSDGMATLVRLLMLKSIDTHWVNHLTQMEDLRTGVGLQAVGQRDPLTVYRTEGQRAFAELNRQMQREITHTLFHVTLAPEAPGQRSAPDAPLQDDAPSARRGRAADRAPVSPMAAVASTGRNCRRAPGRTQDWPQRQVSLRQRPQVQALLRRQRLDWLLAPAEQPTHDSQRLRLGFLHRNGPVPSRCPALRVPLEGDAAAGSAEVVGLPLVFAGPPVGVVRVHLHQADGVGCRCHALHRLALIYQPVCQPLSHEVGRDSVGQRW